jgi:hypothetical protein
VNNLLLSRVHRVDHRTHWDCTERRTEAFHQQMGDLTEAYLEWSYVASEGGYTVPTVPVDANSGEYSIRVVDTFGELYLFSVCS